MFSYIGRGERQYGIKPVFVQSRKNWEFEAVIKGRMAPTFDGRSSPELSESTLWVFAPELRHGWTGDGARASEVLVFHVPTVPEPLASIPGGTLHVPIDSHEIARLVALADEVEGEVFNPTIKGDILVTRVVAELSLLALKRTPNAPLLVGRARDKALVQAATIWLRENIAEGPTLEAAADAVRISSSHLRRLFHAVSGKSPRSVIADLRFQRARALLKNAELTLEDISAACGYSDASALSRAFRKHSGKPPSAFRST